MFYKDIENDALTLLDGGKAPSLKLALYFAAVSPLQELGINGRLAIVLRQYRDKALPDTETLYRELASVRGAWIRRDMLKALYNIEKWHNVYADSYRMGEIENYGNTYTQQCVWREKLNKEVWGIGRKCISFALLIFAPFECQLVPLDRHHLARIAYPRNYCATLAQYKAIEAQLFTEQMRETDDTIRFAPCGLYAWYKWEAHRQMTGASPLTVGVQSHADFSCRR